MLRVHAIVCLVPLLVACGTSVKTVAVPAPEPAPEPSGPPHGAALHAAVLGHWSGMASDGTDTQEEVDLTLGEATYDLSAGVVIGSAGWKVRDDDIIWLEPPSDDSEAYGICFRASAIGPDRITGEWAYIEDDDCAAQWYGVELTRLSP
ncbi:MAG: hypothetical protein U1F43_35110 [Myxococcota bacterium]